MRNNYYSNDGLIQCEYNAAATFLLVFISGGSRNSEKGFPLIVDPRCRGLGAQPPDAE